MLHGLDPSLRAIQSAQESHSARARRLARPNTQSSVNTPGELVGMIEDRHQVAINASAIRAQDDMLGELIDRLA